MAFTLLALILTAEPMTPPPLVQTDDVVRSDTRSRFKHLGTVPAGFHLVEEANVVPIAVGIGLLLGAYVPWAIIGTLQGYPENAVPVMGPMLGFRPVEGWFSGIANFFSVFAIVADAAAQVAGIVVVTVGLATPRRWLERGNTEPSISLVPGAPGSPAGASVIGRF